MSCQSSAMASASAANSGLRSRASLAYRYYDSILALATSFMKIVAISLDEPEETFDSLCRLPAAAIRLL